MCYHYQYTWKNAVIESKKPKVVRKIDPERDENVDDRDSNEDGNLADLPVSEG